jgi:hypothetical protein
MTFVKHFLIVIAILVGGVFVTGFINGLFKAQLPEYREPLEGIILIVGLTATVVFAVRHVVRAVRRPRSAAKSD